MRPFNIQSLLWLPVLAVAGLSPATGRGQTNFSITPSVAFQVSFPGQESYQYQVDVSTDLTTWQPASGIQVSTGGVETLTFGMTNGLHAAYRVQQFPPNLTNRIVGLTNVYFDNAVVQGQGATMTASGFRAISRDYNLDDYLKAEFQFDFLKQTFSLINLQVFTNIGVVCGQSPSYYMINATNRLQMTNGAQTLYADNLYPITATGQVLQVNVSVGQVLAFLVKNFSYTNHLTVSDPTGTVLRDEFIYPSYNWYYGPLGGLIPGVYQIHIVPQGVASESMQLEFHNDNNTTLVTMTNGMTIPVTSYGPEEGDYLKYQVALNGGQTLQLTGPDLNGHLAIYNSLGAQLYTWSNEASSRVPILYTAPNTDTYYLVVAASDYGTSHNYSTTVSITP